MRLVGNMSSQNWQIRVALGDGGENSVSVMSFCMGLMYTRCVLKSFKSCEEHGPECTTSKMERDLALRTINSNPDSSSLFLKVLKRKKKGKLEVLQTENSICIICESLTTTLFYIICDPASFQNRKLKQSTWNCISSLVFEFFSNWININIYVIDTDATYPQPLNKYRL